MQDEGGGRREEGRGKEREGRDAANAAGEGMGGTWLKEITLTSSFRLCRKIRPSPSPTAIMSRAGAGSSEVTQLPQPANSYTTFPDLKFSNSKLP
jgi:hypothetical protein